MTASILAGASRLRDGIPCTFADEEPRVDGSYRVFKLTFQDGVVWAARQNTDPSERETDLGAVEKLQYIKEQRPDIAAPSILVDKEHGVVYNEWVHGEPLTVWNSAIALPDRRRFLDGLAEFLLQLWSVPVPAKFATETESSYSAWLTKSVDRGVRRTLNKTARWGDAVDYLIMRSMIPDYAAELDTFTESIFSHGDMYAHNMLKSETFELTGVIDWEWAFVAPLPAVIHHPWLLANVPGWKNTVVASHEDFAEDRAHLEDEIAKKEKSRGLPPTLSGLLRNSGARLFFQSAFHVKGVHEQFVAMHCQRTEKNLDAAKAQLEIVMKIYPDLEQAALELMGKMIGEGGSM